jgi:hypothetical protein
MMILQVDNCDRRRNVLLARTILFIARTKGSRHDNGGVVLAHLVVGRGIRLVTGGAVDREGESDRASHARTAPE